MTTMHFINLDGFYIGEFEAEDAPENSVPVPTPPNNLRDVWNGEDWDAYIPIAKYFVDRNGTYIGGFEGVDPPEGSIEVPTAPAHALDVWNGEDWDAYIPPPVIPDRISDRQFFQTLADRDMITQAEALAAVKTGEIPPVMVAILDGMPTENRFSAEMLLSGATEFKRSHPLVEAFGAAMSWSAADVDEFWIEAFSK